MPTVKNNIVSDSGARPINSSIGAPKKMAKLLPVTRLIAAGVLKWGSISLRSRMPELMVPVSMPYMERRPS